MIAGIAAVVAIAIVVMIVGAGGDGGETVNEVFREPAGAPGSDPFIESVARAGEDEGIVPEAAGGSTTGTALEVASTPGSEPGLYGGTQNQATCDRERLISFLQDNPSKAEAWASVQGITTDDIPVFINGLTPTRLRYDTRVTNHGHRDGQATSFQSVLQAGTAVLVDDHGLPRARCACGNPLLAPQALTGATYQGPTWSGFSTQNVQVVVSVQVVTQFVIVDINTGSQFTRPVGSDGSDDTLDGRDGLDGTWAVRLDLTCGSELGSEGPTSNSATETWIFRGDSATLEVPDFFEFPPSPVEAPLVQHDGEFTVNVAPSDFAGMNVNGTMADDGAQIQGSGMAGNGTAASSCAFQFVGQRGQSPPASASPATTTSTTATTQAESPAGSPPCTNDALQHALAASAIPGTVDPDHGARCEGGFAAVGILDPPYVASLAIFRADGDQWAVVDDANQCEDRTIPFEIRVWGCNGDPTP